MDNMDISDGNVLRLPQANVKRIAKMDPEVQLVSQDAVYILTKATEYFIEVLSKLSWEQTKTKKKTKMIMKPDVEDAAKASENMIFLEGDVLDTENEDILKPVSEST